VNAVRLIAVLLIVAGVLGLIYQQFSFTREKSEAKIGPLELTLQRKETVDVPLWASIGAIGIGVVLLISGGRKK
jgi:hypothetical protein